MRGIVIEAQSSLIAEKGDIIVQGEAAMGTAKPLETTHGKKTGALIQRVKPLMWQWGK